MQEVHAEQAVDSMTKLGDVHEYAGELDAEGGDTFDPQDVATLLGRS